jgi:TolA-binding protein
MSKSSYPAIIGITLWFGAVWLIFFSPWAIAQQTAPPPANLSIEQQVEAVKNQVKQFVDNLGNQIDIDQNTIRQRDGTIAADILEKQKQAAEQQKQAAQINDLTTERDALKKERDDLMKERDALKVAQPKPEDLPKVETPHVKPEPKK